MQVSFIPFASQYFFYLGFGGGCGGGRTGGGGGGGGDGGRGTPSSIGLRGISFGLNFIASFSTLLVEPIISGKVNPIGYSNRTT